MERATDETCVLLKYVASELKPLNIRIQIKLITADTE
jgi:hypothetical protein